jgi:hypothetical protein
MRKTEEGLGVKSVKLPQLVDRPWFSPTKGALLRVQPEYTPIHTANGWAQVDVTPAPLVEFSAGFQGFLTRGSGLPQDFDDGTAHACPT